MKNVLCVLMLAFCLFVSGCTSVPPRIESEYDACINAGTGEIDNDCVQLQSETAMKLNLYQRTIAELLVATMHEVVVEDIYLRMAGCEKETRELNLSYIFNQGFSKDTLHLLYIYAKNLMLGNDDELLVIHVTCSSPEKQDDTKYYSI